MFRIFVARNMKGFQDHPILEDDFGGYAFDGGPIGIDEEKGSFLDVDLGFEDGLGMQHRAPIIRRRRMA